jgi:hypothetical protein
MMDMYTTRQVSRKKLESPASFFQVVLIVIILRALSFPGTATRPLSCGIAGPVGSAVAVPVFIPLRHTRRITADGFFPAPASLRHLSAGSSTVRYSSDSPMGDEVKIP